MQATQTCPFFPGGAAEDVAPLLGQRDDLSVSDRSHWPRFGLKGSGSADWLADAGVALPAANRLSLSSGFTILRLGPNDITLLGDPAAPEALAALCARWEAAPGPKGYSSWREEAWAWLHLDGRALEDALARLCAVDLRPGRFVPEAIAQTRFAQVDAVVIRRSGAAEVFFDIAASAAVLRTIRHGGGHP